MKRYRLPTKKAAVDFALRSVAGDPMSRREALEMEGTGWEGDLTRIRDEEVERP
jgi:Arc/MetJ family transcription regulator